MAQFEIPLAGYPETFSITLNGTIYQLTIQYRNASNGGWVLDIADLNGVALLSGIPMVTGADLLAPYAYLGIAAGSQITVVNSAGGDSAPTWANLGTDTHLLLVTP